MASATEQPSLAADLAMYPHPRGVLVRLAQRRRTLVVGRREAAALRACDGSRTVEQLKEQLASEFSAREVEKFLVLAEANDLLATDEPVRSSRGSLLQWRIASVPVVSLFRDGRVARLATRWIYLALVPAVAAVWWVLARSGIAVLTQLLAVQYTDWRTIADLVLAIVVIGAVHESAHALTIVSRGGRVFEVGLLLNYFVPAFYVDISGIELLPTKVQRIQVWMAGLAAQVGLFAVGLALQTASFTPAWSRPVLVVVNATNLALFVLNSLFFVKMDGYYVSQELLEIRPLDRVGLAMSMQPAAAGPDLLEKVTALVAGLYIWGYVPLFLINAVAAIVMTRLHVSRGVLDAILISSMSVGGTVLLVRAMRTRTTRARAVAVIRTRVQGAGSARPV